jgi:glycosyltransferase involved in cell wall biosynthesis
MRHPLRICVVAACPLPAGRGTPVRATRLTEALARKGHEVHVATYGSGSGELDPTVHVHRTRDPYALRPDRPGPTLGKLAVLDPLLGILLRRVLDESRFDVVHAHHYEGLLLALWATRGRIPVIYDAHTSLESELPAYAPWLPARLKRGLGRLLDRRLPGRARFTIAVSDPLRRQLTQTGAVSAECVRTVGNGVEAWLLTPVRRPPPPDPDGGVLVYAGNLAPYQGIDHLLGAFRTVRAHRPRARLRILTDSGFEPHERLARELDVRAAIDVRSVPLERLRAELAEAHVALNPRPRCDGVPQKNLNYMAAGLPLVAFAGSLHPYRDGVSGVAVAPVAGEALGRAILDLLARPDECDRLGDAAREALERDHTWERQAARVEGIYREVLSSPFGRVARAVST